MIKVTLKDGSNIEVENGSSVLDVAKKISEGLARVATCASVNGETKDLRYEVKGDSTLNIYTFDNDLEGKKAYWHTTSHIMAQAVKRLFPNAKLAIGPAIDNGFYYDYDVEKPFSQEDLENIEKEMSNIVKENLAIERFGRMPMTECAGPVIPRSVTYPVPPGRTERSAVGTWVCVPQSALIFPSR